MFIAAALLIATPTRIGAVNELGTRAMSWATSAPVFLPFLAIWCPVGPALAITKSPNM
jgi:hypothetical protein